MTDLSSFTSIFPFPTLQINKKKSDIEIFSINYKNINHEEMVKVIDTLDECIKSANLSTILREQGNEEYKKSNYQAAFEMYYKSLGVAPADSLEYSLALANRSAALFGNKNYEDCIKDIKSAIDANYPEEKLSKLYIRQTECHIYLQQNLEAGKSWAKALEYIEKFKETVGPPQNYNAELIAKIAHVFGPNKLLDQVNTRVKNVLETIESLNNEMPMNEDIAPKLELKNGENAKFLKASNNVEIRTNLIHGRHVVTKTDIEPGDILFIEEPYGFVRNNEPQIFCTYCSNCLLLSMSNIPCKGCPLHFYCSEKCRQQSWDTTHKWECFSERKRIFDAKVRLALNILLKASYNNFKTHIEDESVYGNKGENFAFINKLVTNKDKMTEDEMRICVKSAIIVVTYLRECTDFFEWLRAKPENADKSLPVLYDIIGSISMKLYMQITCNETQIIGATICYYQTPIIDVRHIGLGMYASSALINHSCNPNSLVYFEQTLKIVLARNKIPKDTEITIDYCKYRSDQIGRYGIYLTEKYKFNCPCLKCRDPTSLKNEDAPWLCEKCSGKAFYICNEKVQCINPNCQNTFYIRKYLTIEEKMPHELLTACLKVDLVALDTVHEKFKKIYHKDNIKFIGFYLGAYEFYLANCFFEKCLELCRRFVEFCDQFNEVNDIKILAYMRLMVALTKKYNLMKTHADFLPEETLEEIFSTLNETKRLLGFYIPFKFIKQYEKYVKKTLDL